jgi:hypothetical protein
MKILERQKAIALRRRGVSVRTIARKLQVSKASVSVWTRSTILPEPKIRACRKCGKEFPPTCLIDGERRVLTSRRYCLDCSPFRGNNRLKLHVPRVKNEVCGLCQQPTKGGRLRCYTCTSRIRRFRTKSAAVKLLGGRCSRCKWAGHIAGFQFHHLRDKDFAVGGCTNSSWDVIKREIAKCELLCACCHMIEHSGEQGGAFLAAVNEYKGKLLDFKA